MGSSKKLTFLPAIAVQQRPGRPLEYPFIIRNHGGQKEGVQHFFPSADRKEQSSQNYFELIKFPSGLNKLQEIGKEKNSKEIYTKC